MERLGNVCVKESVMERALKAEKVIDYLIRQEVKPGWEVYCWQSSCHSESSTLHCFELRKIVCPVQTEEVDRIRRSLRLSACLLDACRAQLRGTTLGGLAQRTGKVRNASECICLTLAVICPLLKTPSLDSAMLEN